MAATQIGIVYESATGALRRWILPDSDSNLIEHHKTEPDETMLLVDRGSIPAEPTAATPFVLAAIRRVRSAAP